MAYGVFRVYEVFQCLQGLGFFSVDVVYRVFKAYRVYGAYRFTGFI